jgi:hypothetical protein
MPMAPTPITRPAGSLTTPRHWSVAEITTGLERLGFTVQPPLQWLTDSAGLDYVARLLSTEDGGQSEGTTTALTEEIRSRIQKWLDERRDAFNEDLSRILLGEHLSGRQDGPAPQDFLGEARPLIQEMAELAEGPREHTAVSAASGHLARIRELAAGLSDLFSRPGSSDSLAASLDAA